MRLVFSIILLAFSGVPLLAQDNGTEDAAAAAANEAKLISGTRQVTFGGRRAGEGYFSADGQRTTQVDEGDVIQVRQSRRSVRLVHLADSSFFQALRHKLHWRGGSL